MSNDQYDMLQDAIVIATGAHRGQVDKQGQQYILHPMVVMDMVDGYEEKIVAVLHDVVEDTVLTVEDIRLMFGDTIGDAIEAITHLPNESNDTYHQRCKANALARVVKLADMEHNLSRLEGLPEKDVERMTAKWTKGLEILRGYDYEDEEG